MIAQTIYSKLVKKIPEHIYLLGVKHEFSSIEIQVMAWNQTKTFMELNKKNFKQLEYKNNITYILNNIKKLK